jgi:hypothetical protein
MGIARGPFERALAGLVDPSIISAEMTQIHDAWSDQVGRDSWTRFNQIGCGRPARLRSLGPRNGPQSLFEVFDFSLLPGGPYKI